jgi:DNA relaxase NicK
MYIDATAHSRKLKCTHLVNSQGGSTLYVGSRNSDQFGRLYDKGAQQGGPPGFTWRYEVELKNAYSTAATQYLVNNMGKPTEDQQRDLSAFVYSWWRDRGVKPLFSPVTGDMIVAVSKQQTTLDRKLTWLRGQVRPTIQQLIAAGLGKDALEALGLPDYTQGEF